MSMQLSDEQQNVVNFDENKFTVRAAAGSGKTRILVERYINHVINDHIPPDKILTITFTKKAASEMKKRIVEALLEQGRYSDAQIAETGPIQTIHSFCERLLRENALSAGIDPQFLILSEVQAAEIYEEAVLSTLDASHQGTCESQQLITLLAGKLDYNAPKTLHSKLNGAISNVLRSFRGSGWSPDTLDKIYSQPEILIEEWQKAVLKEFPENISNLVPPGPLESWILKLHETLKEESITIPKWLKSIKPHINQEAAHHSTGLMQHALNTWLEIDKIMEQKQSFDFPELESRSVRLLANSEQTIERLQKQYQVILVDESQDVNPVQYQLIDSLGIKTEMMVGDPQQSIYGFRQADLTLFMGRTTTRPCLGLTRNYRSEPGVLKFVDDLFSQIWGAEYAHMGDSVEPNALTPLGSTHSDYKGVEFWSKERNDYLSVAINIQQLISEGYQPKDIAILIRQSSYATNLGQYLERMKIPYQISGGSEKFYTRLEVRDLANTLNALADPQNDFAMLAMLHSPVVDLSLDSLIILGSHKPVIQALQNFNSPIEIDNKKLQKFALWFTELCQFSSRMPAWEVISEVFQASPYLENLASRPDGQQSIANVRKLLKLAANEPELGPLEFANRIRNIQQIRHREGDAPSLDDDANLCTIMTVHKSKGLEFPVVILPDLYQKLNRPIRDIASEPRDGMMFARLAREQSIFHEWVDFKRKKADREEELRILYVAMTRAKQKLCLCVQKYGSLDTIAGMIPRAFSAKDIENIGIKIR